MAVKTREAITGRQHWFLRSLIGCDTRDIGVDKIDKGECTNLISQLVSGGEAEKAEIKALFIEYGAKPLGAGGTDDETLEQFAMADAAGREAAACVEPGEFAGLVFVRVDPGTSKFARLLKEKGAIKGANLTGGMRYPVKEFDNYRQNEAYALEFAAKLRNEYKVAANAYVELL